MAGRKPESFTDKENDALRSALRGLATERGWSQAETGRQLGIGQQAAGTLLNRGGGFSRPTAEKLAALLDAESANAIIHAAGAAANPMTVPQGWAARDIAVSVARRFGYEEEAIRRVVVKFQESHYVNRPARWWNDRIVAEAAEMRAEVEAAALAPPRAPAPPALPAKRESSEMPAAPRRKRA